MAASSSIPCAALWAICPSRWRTSTCTTDRCARPDGSPAAPAHPGHTAANSGCPVDGATLFQALQGDSAVVQNLPQSLSGLNSVTCYQGYATALTTAPGADSVAVLFRYQASAGTWSVVDYGSSMTCAAVPPAILSHLPYCFPA